MGAPRFELGTSSPPDYSRSVASYVLSAEVDSQAGLSLFPFLIPVFGAAFCTRLDTHWAPAHVYSVALAALRPITIA